MSRTLTGIDTTSRAETIAARAGNLPVLPQVATRVLQLAQNPDVKNGELEMAISRDPALTAQLLKISNSALYGQRGSVATLRRAIAVMGLSTLRSAVVAASTESLFRSKNSRFQDRILWEHSLAVALASRLVAHAARYPAGDEAFTAGLLHDIGKVVLDANFGDEYRTVLEHVYNEGATFVEAERDIFGFDHAEVGAVVVDKWNLAPHLRDAVRDHHSPPPDGSQALCSIVSLGNALAVKLGLGPEKFPDLDLASHEATLVLGLDGDTLDRLGVQLVERLEQEKGLFGI
jgi:putative nucleotidyltransferase with HDIG domain